MEAIVGGVTFVDSENGRQYEVHLVPENKLTDDPSGRFPVGPISWRDGRLPFMFSDVEGDPHEEARHVGNLFNLRREEIEGAVWVVADLDWDNDELAIEAKRLVDEDRIVGVSIAPSDLEAFLICGVPDAPTAESVKQLAEQFNPDECAEDDWVEAWVNIVLGSATLLINPAFEDAKVITEPEVVMAAGVPVASEGLEATPFTNVVFTDKIESNGTSWPDKLTFEIVNPAVTTLYDDLKRAVTAASIHRPPVDWFNDPELREPTPLSIDDDGKVYGHLALWSTCHRGFDSQCVTPPPDATDYDEFHSNARVILEDGESLGVGCLTFDVSHADTRASAEVAKRHYDHSGTVAAFVRAGQDNHGVWVAGAIRPGLSVDQIELMRRLSLSGDWRPRGGQYFLIAAQAVPVPGFPIRARVASGEVTELTTRGPVNDYDPLEVATDEALVVSAVQHLVNEIRGLRSELEHDRRIREYEKALTVFG